jgi:nudix-type nucleoside diphosphatase (YffH/AdpP family)
MSAMLGLAADAADATLTRLLGHALPACGGRSNAGRLVHVRMRRVEVYSKKRVFDGFFKIDEAELSFEHFDGRMSRSVHRLCFERGDSVAAMIYNRDSRRFIFVEQFKFPTFEKGPGWILETVAGIVETDETPEEALRREALEEVGYELETLEPIARFYLSPGGSSERILLYYAEVTNAGKVADGGGAPWEEEDIRSVELSPDELDVLVADGGIHDAKTLVGAQWLQKRASTIRRR